MSKLEQHEFSDFHIVGAEQRGDFVQINVNYEYYIDLNKEDIKVMAQHFGLIGEDDV